jgi:hypothetical protein
MYRFKGGDTREDFNQIVQASSPQLLGIATRLVEDTSVEAWEMLHIIMKAYKHAIYVGFFFEHSWGSRAKGHQVRSTALLDASRPDGWLVHLVPDDRR